MIIIIVNTPQIPQQLRTHAMIMVVATLKLMGVAIGCGLDKCGLGTGNVNEYNNIKLSNTLCGDKTIMLINNYNNTIIIIIMVEPIRSMVDVASGCGPDKCGFETVNVK